MTFVYIYYGSTCITDTDIWSNVPMVACFFFGTMYNKPIASWKMFMGIDFTCRYNCRLSEKSRGQSIWIFCSLLGWLVEGSCQWNCFLAHLRGAYAIKRRPSPSSSVSRARFVTVGAIDPKLCTYVPLGKSNSQTKFRSSLILGLTTREQKPKTQKVL
jgi:hypothetical protein